MKKTEVYGTTLKEQLKASAQDKLYSFVMSEGSIRGCLVNATKMVNEMRANHEFGILETLVLGHAYIAGALIASGLKGDDRICLQIQCSGPIQGLVVESNAFGEVRGYLKNVPIPVDSPLENFNLSPFFGAGFISLTKYLKSSKHPFKGQVELQHGSIAKDLTYYYSKSEQTPTSLNLSVKFDPEGRVIGAGGLLIQVLPGADEKVIENLEETVMQLPSLGEYFAEKKDSDNLIHTSFKKNVPKILANHRVEFMCHCSKDRMKGHLLLLPAKDIDDLCENGPFPLELRCHYCNSKYLFNQDSLKEIQIHTKKQKHP